jgi:hypothetical protein
MAFQDDLNRYIDNRVNANIRLLQMKVGEVDEENYTATVEGMGFKFTKANLRSLSLNDDKGVIIIPKADSYVYVATMKRENPLIISYSEIDKVIMKNDNSEIVMDNDKISVIADKIYINTDGETEPVTLGNQNKSMLESIFDYINDTLQLMLQHTHSSFGAPPNEAPLMIAKKGEVSTTKGLTGNTLSDKNFTG